MKRYFVIFKGLVQGVGFRWTIMQLARAYGYTGWIRNLSNGNVSMEIQGKWLDINQLVNQIHSRSNWIRIEDYSIKEIEVVPDERSFSVRG